MSTETQKKPETAPETKLSKFQNIVKFLAENDDHFTFAVGEIGFGRPCVGITQRGADHWVGYTIMSDDDKCEVVARHEGAFGPNRPENAYHKDDFFAVLIHDVDSHFGPTDAQKDEAAAALDRWLGDILAAGYKVQEYPESKHSIGSVFGLVDGKRRTLRAVVNKA